MQPEQNLNQPSNNPPQASQGASARSPLSSGPSYSKPDDDALPPIFSLSQHPPEKKKRFKNLPSWLSTLALLLLAPLIALSISAFVIQSYQVDGQSMETTLQNDDRLIVDKWPRTWSHITGHSYVPKRGNIIIFNQSGLDFAGSGSKQLIKRVIGLPGERVVVNGGTITIYNKQHPDGFDPDKAGIYHIDATVTSGNVDLRLQDDEIFVCGDNRANSEDSRFFGPVKVDQIVGKLAFRIVPISKAQKF